MTQSSTPPPEPTDPAAQPYAPMPPGHVPTQQGYGTAPGYASAPGQVPAHGYGVPPAGYGGPAHPGWQPLAPDGAPLADFGHRLAAYLIDAVIVTVAIMVLLVPIAFGVIALASTGSEEAAAAAIPLLFLVYFAAIFGAYWIYLVEMMFRTGQTIGKRVMKIRIVPIDPTVTLTRGMAGRRYLVQVVAGFLGSCAFFAYIDGLWQLWDKPYRQCLHDKFAQTVVIRVTQ